VYDLTVLRYDQGMASQLEVTDARLSLLQARANRAQAIAQYYIADASVQRARGVSSAELSQAR
jgi:outer membrane protein TolC